MPQKTKGSLPMKVIIAILAFVMLSQAQAQVDPSADQSATLQPAQTLPAAPKKRAVLYDERTNELVEVQPQVPAETQQAATVASPIYILNNQKYQGYQGTQQSSGQAQIQEQPTTIVSDTPLTSSPADHMRKKRQDAESTTEDGIVQALEKARMDDEIRRRDRFNSAIGSGVSESGAQAAPQQVPVAPPPQPIVVQPVIQKVVPVPVTLDEEEGDEEEVVSTKSKKQEEPNVDIRSEIRAAVKEATAKPEEKSQFFISGLVGLGKYPDVVNVRGNVASGFVLGLVTADRVIAEGSFIYADYELEDMWRTNSVNPAFPRIVDMRQYNFGMAIKYQLLPGRLRPNVGVMANYVRRSFEEHSYEFRTSDAFDVGLVTGLDLYLTEVFAIGVDFRYATNVSYRDNTSYRTSFVYPQSRNEIERLDYYTGTLSGKFSF